MCNALLVSIPFNALTSSLLCPSVGLWFPRTIFSWTMRHSTNQRQRSLQTVRDLRSTYSLHLLGSPDHIVTLSLAISSRLELLNRRASLRIPQMVLSNSMWSSQEIIDEVLILILQHDWTRWSSVSSRLKRLFSAWFIFVLYAKIQAIQATRQTRTFSLTNFVWSITISRLLVNYFNNV